MRAACVRTEVGERWAFRELALGDAIRELGRVPGVETVSEVHRTAHADKVGDEPRIAMCAEA